MFDENSLSSSSSWVLVKAVRIRLELLRVGDVGGGGVGVVLRDGDSFVLDPSEKFKEADQSPESLRSNCNVAKTQTWAGQTQGKKLKRVRK